MTNRSMANSVYSRSSLGPFLYHVIKIFGFQNPLPRLKKVLAIVAPPSYDTLRLLKCHKFQYIPHFKLSIWKTFSACGGLVFWWHENFSLKQWHSTIFWFCKMFSIWFCAFGICKSNGKKNEHEQSQEPQEPPVNFFITPSNRNKMLPTNVHMFT